MLTRAGQHSGSLFFSGWRPSPLWPLFGVGYILGLLAIRLLGLYALHRVHYGEVGTKHFTISNEVEFLLCVESALSKFSEADIQTGSTDSLFRKSPASGMAENRLSKETFLI